MGWDVFASLLSVGACAQSICFQDFQFLLHIVRKLSDFPSYSFPRTRMQWHTTWYNVVPGMIQCSAWDRIVIYIIKVFISFFYFILCQHFRKLSLFFQIILFKVWWVFIFILPLHSLSPFLWRLYIEIVLWKIYIERETGSTVCSSFGSFHLVLPFREKGPRIPFVFHLGFFLMFHGFWIVVLTGPAFLFFFFRLMISLILIFTMESLILAQDER